ncbi:uncharacterized protein LOC136082677 [Hydra vulgaris]|uniref:Uncharacterized protein LOC136082677 n=1 Tax=Hydra vulgaris TaxID=6087 RepID=A0ABM4C944_HYDVU
MWKVPYLVNLYNTVRNQIKKYNRSAIGIFEEDLSNDKRNPKRLFNYINSKRSSSSSINALITESDISIKKVDIANVLKSWLEANVTPLYKKGCKTDPANYRPVSLTSGTCKILEKIVRDKITKHLFHNNLITTCQHGFVTNKSSITNLLETMDFITFAKSNKKSTDVIFLDYAKAFDKVPCKPLLFKLEKYGIVREKISGWVPVTSGVPQGSVLGPTLFIIYVNDLPDKINNVCKMYADDTKILSTIESKKDCERLQSDINWITEWTRMWQMQLNESKCKVMHILGSSNLLKFDYYINDLSTHQRIKLEVTTTEQDLVYERPHLEYAVSIWSPYLKKDIKILEKIQKRAPKIPHNFHNLNYSILCSAIKCSSLEKRRQRGYLIQNYKLENFKNKVVWHQEPMKISSRADQRLQYRREIINNCAQRYYFFNNRVASIWNTLPDNLVMQQNTNSFKNNIDKYNEQK